MIARVEVLVSGVGCGRTIGDESGRAPSGGEGVAESCVLAVRAFPVIHD